MITVTLFKLRGIKAADDFRMSIGHRGDALGEWDYLTLDKRLKTMGVKFVVRDYHDVKTLPPLFTDRIKTPIYLNLHYGDNYENSVAYPEKSPLEAGAIRQWIMAYIKKIAPEKLSVAENLHSLNDSQPVQVVQQSPAKTSSAVTNEIPVTKVETKPAENVKPTLTEADLQETAGGLFKLGLGIGGTLLVAALAIAGVAVGSMAADNFNNDDDDLAASNTGGDDEYALFIESITGGKMDFTKIWEERAPTIFKTKIQKEKEEMQTPVPVNLQTVNPDHVKATKPIAKSPFDTDLNDGA